MLAGDERCVKRILNLDRAVLSEAVDGWLQTTGSANWGQSCDIVKADNRGPAIEIILDALLGVLGHMIAPDQFRIDRNLLLEKVVRETAEKYRQ